MRCVASTTLFSVVLALLAGDPALAQHAFERTKTVDKSTRADFTSIQAAINDIPDDPDERWTVLIYAGVYDLDDPNNPSPLVLDDTKENVDLVGVDPDAVIIKAAPNKNGIEIKGLGERNNSIRNLTIVLDDPNNAQTAILIQKVGTGDDPSDIEIVNVTIKCEAANSTAIDIEDPAEDIKIRQTTISMAQEDSNGILISGGTAQNPTKGIQILGGTISCADEQSVAIGVGASAVAENITIAGVSIRSEKAAGTVVDLGSTQNVRISNLKLEAQDGYGIKVGDKTTIRHSRIVVEDGVGSGGSDADAGLFANGKDNLTVTNCTLQGRRNGIRLEGECQKILVANCAILGANEAAYLQCVDEAIFKSCRIVADSTLGDAGGDAGYHGVYVTNTGSCEPGKIRFESCVIQAISKNDGDDAYGVRVVQAPDPNEPPIHFVDCGITSTASDDGEKSFGVVADEAEAISLVGGSIASSDSDDREADQFDLLNNAASGLGIRVTGGTTLSKWKGAIGAAGRQKSLIQRTIDVDVPSDTAILEETALIGPEQEIVPPTVQQPDVYRVLKVKRNHTSGAQSVIIIGTNFAGDTIAEKITVGSGGTEEDGVKPFKTVTKVYLPAKTGDNQTMSVGTTWKLGLHSPISAAADVTQEARLVNNIYTTQTVGTVDLVYATVIPSTRTAGDSFEWAVLASQ